MKILEFLQESNGQLSSSRLFALIVTLCFCADWVVHIINQQMYDPTLTIVGIVIGINGLKVAQKPFEEKPLEAAK
jgi:hypothetical protein